MQFRILSVLAVLSLAPPATAQDPSLGDLVNERFQLHRSELVTLDFDTTVGESIGFPLRIGDQDHLLALEPYSIRAPGYRLQVQGENGELRDVEAGAVRTMRGEIMGDPGSVVAASWTPGGISARIVFSNREEYWLEPITTEFSQAAWGQHVLYNGDDVDDDHAGTCAATQVARHVTSLPQTKDGILKGTAAACGTGLCIAQLGCDADFDYFQDYGSSVTAVENRINNIINSVNVQYEAEVDIQHQITGIIVRATVSDPYNASTISGLLNQIQSVWNGGGTGIPHDIAELFTGRNLSGSTIGVAWLSAVCGSLRYSVVENLGSFGCATDLSAHELGHNWGAGHCSCGSFTMNSGLTCSNQFTNGSINSISNFRDNIGCLTAGCEPGPGTDCNSNGTDDACDIGSGFSDDFNNNGIPDECESQVTVFVDNAAAAGGNGTSGSPYNDIASGIQGAKSGDTVIVRDGTGLYTGAGNRGLDLEGRQIVLRSQNGPGSVTLDGGLTLMTPIFVLSSGESSSSVIEGFTVTGGNSNASGGGFAIDGSSPTIRNCVITGNRADISGGGLAVTNGSPTILNSSIVDNTAGSGIINGAGGGLILINSSAVIRGCTIAANTAIDGFFQSGEGGGLRVQGDFGSTITSSVIWGNTAALDASIDLLIGSAPTVTFSNVQGGHAGAGNLDVDPDFVLDGPGGDYHLMPGSPMDGMGNTGAVTGGETDIDGEPRVLSSVVEMGSDEIGTIVCQNDLGFAGQGNMLLSFCGAGLDSGQTSDLLLTGAQPGALLIYVLGLNANPVPFAGGQLVPVPILSKVFILADGLGNLNLAGLAGGGGPFNLYLQVVTVDGAQPSGFALSNAIEAVYGP